jgi:hypothetical protein
LSQPSMDLIDAHAGTMDYQKHLSAEVRGRMPGWIQRFTYQVRAECDDLGIPFVDMSHDYNSQANRALTLLTTGAS